MRAFMIVLFAVCHVFGEEPLFRMSLETSGKHQPLILTRLDVEVDLIQDLSQTKLTLTYTNPNLTTLEGQFVFRPGVDKTIVGFALDIGGVMHPAAAVEKSRGQEVFEAITRREVDPALLESVDDGAFRLRVYPIPGRGARTVSITLQGNMTPKGNEWLYSLPWHLEEEVTQTRLQVRVHQGEQQPLLTGAQGKWSKRGGTWGLLEEIQGRPPGKSLQISQVRNMAAPTVFVGEDRGQTFFHIRETLAPAYERMDLPKTVAILWDVSGSSKNRNHAREFNVLAKYLEKTKGLTLKVIPFHITKEEEKQFQIKSRADIQDVLKYLKQLIYDGGTQFRALNLAEIDADAFLLFSDGRNTFGTRELVSDDRPLWAINSGAGGNTVFLERLADRTGGGLVDLTKINDRHAVRAMFRKPLRLMEVRVDEGEIDDLLPASPRQIKGAYQISGRLLSERAKVTAIFGYAGKEALVRTMIIDPKQAETSLNVGRLWGQAKVEEHLRSYPDDWETIVDIGQHFSIVTPYTSLIVLERLDDYIEFEIVPPEPLREAYETAMAERSGEEAEFLEEIFEAIDEDQQALFKWWSQDFSATVNKKEFPRMKTFDRTLDVKVVNKATGEPLIMATVVLMKDSFRKAQHTDSDGVSTFSRLESAELRVHVKSKGFHSQDLVVDLTDQPHGRVTVELTTLSLDRQPLPEREQEPQPTPAAPSTHSISFNISSAADRDPLPGVTVVVKKEGLSKGAATDAQGKVKISHLGPHLYTAEISFFGFQTQTHQVDLTQEPHANLAVALEDSPDLVMDELVVTAEAAPARVRTTSLSAGADEMAVDYSISTAGLPTGRGIDSQIEMHPEIASGARHTLKPVEKDAAYLDALEQESDPYAAYLKQRKSYEKSPSFFFETARWFYQKGESKISLRILGNLAEMNLENAPLLRMLAFACLEFGFTEQAARIYEHVLILRPEEPHAYRDLALALSQLGEHQRALDLLSEILSIYWDDRFSGIEEVVLNDVRGIVAQAKKGQLNLSAFPEKWRKSMPVDLRLTMTWDANDTDIDLWLVEPSGDRCYYKRTLSTGGSRYTEDFTEGYGPEEIMRREITPGTYQVIANYFGKDRYIFSDETHVLLNIFTHYGHPDQEHHTVFATLKEKDKEQSKVTLATIEVSKDGQIQVLPNN